MKTFFQILYNHIIIKIIITALLVFGLVMITASLYVKSGFSAFEYTLILLSDKFMLSLFWMSGLIVWNYDLFSLKNEKGILAFKCGSTRKWFSINLFVLLIRAFLFSVEIVVCIIVFSIFLGMTYLNQWSSSAIYGTVNIVDGLDYYGHPFINLINQSLPVYSVLCSIPLLAVRNLVYSLSAVIVLCISYNMEFAYVIAAMINYFDVYCCSYFSYETNRGQLIGIRYFSCYSKEASTLGVNYVFPSSGEPIILRDGIQQYCPQLNEAFLMTETEYLPEYKSIKQLESSLKKASCKHAFRLTHSDFADETKVQFPSGEMYIPARSFYNCSNQKTVYLTDAIVGIGNRAFHGCKSLELLRIGRKNNALPIQLETIGNGAFSGCENLKKVILPKGLKYIGTWAFCGCNGLEKLKIPSTVDFIGRGVISGCNNIRTIEVDALNQTFYSKSNCIIRRSTNTVVVGICNDEEYSTPPEITGIEDGAYSRNQHMKQLMITTGVKKIGEWAFEYCRNLEGIDFPDSIESIGAWAFQDCTKLKELHLYSKLKSIGYQAFAGCENLEMVELPNSLESLSYGIFSNCTELKSIYYHGTKKSWEKIDKDNEWDSFTEDYTLYFSNDTWVTKEELHKE